MGYIVFAIVVVILLTVFVIAFKIHAFFWERKQKALEKQKIEKGIWREKRYWSEIEPKFRSKDSYVPRKKEYKTYPPDWQIRRTLVYFRQDGLCESCNRTSGSIETTKEDMWYGEGYFLKKHVSGSHVHHIKHLSDGGDHSFENLQLLCKACHTKKHSHLKNLQ